MASHSIQGDASISPSAARIDLPIEGYTPWPQIMRLVAIASFLLVMLLACTLFLLVPEESLNIRLDQLMLGMAAFLIFEMVIMRCLIIPMNGDYGRFRIDTERVDFYPLSTMGFAVESRMQSIPVSDFKGIAVQELDRREGAAAKYAVLMIHEKRANMIYIGYAPTRQQAESDAQALSAALKLPVISVFA